MPSTEAPAPLIEFNPDHTIQALQIGGEQNTVVAIDNFLADPHALMAYASMKPDFTAPENPFYPGVRKALPASYDSMLRDALTPVLQKEYNLPEENFSVDTCHYSLVTKGAQELHPLQCAPHFDATTERQFASILYLTETDMGGTSLYRHRGSGFEHISAARIPRYEAMRQEDIRRYGPPTRGYINGDTPAFQRICNVSWRFNRLVIYRSNLLHSGNIETDFSLSPDPKVGRLTATSFIHY